MKNYIVENWSTITGIIGLVIIIAEIARVTTNHYSQKKNDDRAASETFSKATKKGNNMYPFTYSGPLFFEGKNKRQAHKSFLKLKNQQAIFQKILEKKTMKLKK